MHKLFEKKNIILFLPYIAIYVLLILFFYKIVFYDYNFYWRDLLSHSYPAKKIFVDAINAGEFPLWNPLVSVGLPYLADLSNQPLYIFNLIFLILPANVAMNLTILLHFFLCAIFTYLLVKDLTANKLIGLFSAIAFTFCGYNLSVSCNLEYLSAIIWLPATFWAFYRLLSTKKTFYLFWVSVFLSQLIFAGEPMAFYFLAGFLFLRCLFEIKADSINYKPILLFIIVLISSLILSAAQLLPAIELVLNSIRSTGLSFNEATVWSFNPLRSIEFFLPMYFGFNIPYPLYWGGFLQRPGFDVPWAEGVYLGIIPLILAFLAFYHSRTIEKKFWLGLTGISLIISFGAFTPIYKILFYILPMFSSFRYPEKLILFVSLGICVLAGLGLKDIINNKFEISKNTIWFIATLIVVFLFAIFFDYSSQLPLYGMKLSGTVTPGFINGNIIFRLIYFLIVFIIFCAACYKLTKKPDSLNKLIILLMSVTLIDLFIVNSNFYSVSKYNFYKHQTQIATTINKNWKEIYPPRVFCSQFLSKYIPKEKNLANHEEFLDRFYETLNLYWLEQFVPNRSIINNIATYRTVSSLGLKEIKKPASFLYLKDKRKYFNFLNIDYILASPVDLKSFEKYTRVITINENNILLKPLDINPRAIMLYNAMFFDNTTEVEDVLLNLAFDISKTALLKEQKKEPFLQQDPLYDLNFLQYNYNKVKISVTTNKDGYLILFDSFYPGWKAYINNKETTVIRADNVYKAIKIPSGKHIVTFVFDPFIFKLGLIISLAGLITAICLLLKYKELKFLT